MSGQSRFHPPPLGPAPLRLVSAPNVTPLLGILIVLLVSYMASLPQRHEALDVILWSEEAHVVGWPPPNTGVIYDPLMLEISSDGNVAINRHLPVPVDQLTTRLKDIMANRRRKEIYVVATPTLRYGQVARVIDALKGGGVERIVMMPANGSQLLYPTPPTPHNR